jgi:hypothetical protein
VYETLLRILRNPKCGVTIVTGTDTIRLIVERLQSHFQVQKQKEARLEAKYGLGKKYLGFFFEEIDSIKRQLKPEKTPSSKKRKAVSPLSTEIN